MRTISLITVLVATTLLCGCSQQNRLRIWPIAGATPPPPAEQQAPARDPRPVTQSLTAPGGVRALGRHPQETHRPPATTLSNVRQHTFSSVGRDFDPDLHPDGQMVVFASTRNSETADVFYKSVDGFTITQLTTDPADDVQPRLSPNGNQVVFSSNRTGNWDLWLINMDGTGLTQLTRHAGDEMGATWSPDGNQIAFTMWGARSKQWEIWMIDVASPGVRRFMTYGMFPDWSPDGRSIAFQRARQRGTRWFSVWKVDLVDGEARHPTEIAYSESAACTVPRWSPDGTRLVYCAVRDTSVVSNENTPEQVAAEVWQVDARSGVRTKVVHAGASAFNPIWGADGRIFFVSAQAGTENIWSSSRDALPRPVGRPQLSPPAATRPPASAPPRTSGTVAPPQRPNNSNTAPRQTSAAGVNQPAATGSPAASGAIPAGFPPRPPGTR